LSYPHESSPQTVQHLDWFSGFCTLQNQIMLVKVIASQDCGTM